MGPILNMAYKWGLGPDYLRYYLRAHPPSTTQAPQGSLAIQGVKNSRRQAPPFTVSQINELHRKLDSDDIDPFDRAFVAHVLTGIYTRSRHSDLRKIYRIILDVDEHGGFVELQTRHHKNAKSAMKKPILLPILAPARGVDGSVWPLKVLVAFEAVCLSFNGYLNQSLFKPVDAQGFSASVESHPKRRTTSSNCCSQMHL